MQLIVLASARKIIDAVTIAEDDVDTTVMARSSVTKVAEGNPYTSYSGGQHEESETHMTKLSRHHLARLEHRLERKLLAATTWESAVRLDAILSRVTRVRRKSRLPGWPVRDPGPGSARM